MNAARKLFEDLVEKRLWPVALLLVIAAIAVPVLLGAGSGAAQPAPPAPPAAVAAATPAVDLVGPPAVRSRPGSVRDPFRRPKRRTPKPASPRKASGAGSSNAGAAGSPGAGAPAGDAKVRSGSRSGSGPGSGSEQATSSKTTVTRVAPTESAAEIAARSTYETVASFIGWRRNYQHALTGLAFFGALSHPALQYLGVSAGGGRAIFLLGPEATIAGAGGACVVAEPCRAIGLRQGESLRVAVADGQRVIRHYVLKVTSLRRVRRASRALAVAQRERVAPDGRRVLRAIVKDAPTAAAFHRLHYVADTGTVALVDAP